MSKPKSIKEVLEDLAFEAIQSRDDQEGWTQAKTKALDQLYQLILEIIGEDEKVVFDSYDDPLTIVDELRNCKNMLRQEQRQKLNNLFGKGE